MTQYQYIHNNVSPNAGDLIEWDDWATGRPENWVKRIGIVLKVNQPANHPMIYQEDYTVLQSDGTIKKLEPRSSLQIIRSASYKHL